jgi:hypothetical protein
MRNLSVGTDGVDTVGRYPWWGNAVPADGYECCDRNISIKHSPVQFLAAMETPKLGSLDLF